MVRVSTWMSDLLNKWRTKNTFFQIVLCKKKRHRHWRKFFLPREWYSHTEAVQGFPPHMSALHRITRISRSYEGLQWNKCPQLGNLHVIFSKSFISRLKLLIVPKINWGPCWGLRLKVSTDSGQIYLYPSNLQNTLRIFKMSMQWYFDIPIKKLRKVQCLKLKMW